MINIYIPNNNIEERRYILDVIFGEFLGLSYQLIIDNGKLIIDDWIIELENGNRLIVKDSFFNKFPKDLEYLDEKNIPKEVKFTKNRFASEDDIVAIFGTSLPVTNNQYTNTPKTKNQKLKTNIDIFASAFFMLTRWEEHVNKARDNHNRFSAKDSLAYKHNFLHRPVVNEYVEYLWNMLKEIGIKQKRKDREYKFVMTHDVDEPLRYFSTYRFAKEIGRDFLKNGKYLEPFSKMKEFISIKLKLKDDIFNTFDYMIEKEKDANVKAYYFFMGEGTNLTYDDNYDINAPFVKNIAKKILSNSNVIGIHPSFNTYNNSKQFAREKRMIEDSFNITIDCGRQHYLRFEVPTTWQIWNDNGMKWDSTLSYADKEGFRCGVCYEFSVFNFLTRQKLTLKEKPLIVMEASFTIYQSHLDLGEILKNIKEVIDLVKKYNGEFVFLWHNGSFLEDWHREFYEKVLVMAKGK